MPVLRCCKRCFVPVLQEMQEQLRAKLCMWKVQEICVISSSNTASTRQGVPITSSPLHSTPPEFPSQ